MGTNEPGVYAPYLAESWELAPDKSYYDFHLRQGVKFHDGTDFDAHAAVFCLTQLKESTLPYLPTVTSVEALDDYTIRLNLSEWNITILDDLALTETGMISPTAFEKYGVDYMQTHPVGTGPFMFKEFVPRQTLTLEKFPDYWQEGKPYLDGIEITTIIDRTTCEFAFRSGELHLLEEVDIPTAESVTKEGYPMGSLVFGGKMMLYFNSTDPDSVWSNQKVRQATEYAINKEEICQSLTMGYYPPSYEVVHGINQVGNPGTTPRKYNPEKAKQLLAEAGYPDGFKVDCLVNTKFNCDELIAVQEDLSEVGIDIDIQVLDGAKFNEVRFNVVPVNTVIFGRDQAGVGAIAIYTYENHRDDAIFFKGLKRPDAWSDLLLQCIHTESSAGQIAILEEIERIGYEELMHVPLWFKPNIDFFQPTVKWNPNEYEDFRFQGARPFPNWQYVWLEE